ALEPLSPGSSRSFRLGPLTVRHAAPRPLPAVEQRQLSLAYTAASAARQAADLIRKGPTQQLTVGGHQMGVPPHFAGPVSGRVSRGAAKFFGPGFGAEAAQVDAFLAHARTAVFGIIGQRPNAQSLA